MFQRDIQRNSVLLLNLFGIVGEFLNGISLNSFPRSVHDKYCNKICFIFHFIRRWISDTEKYTLVTRHRDQSLFLGGIKRPASRPASSFDRFEISRDLSAVAGSRSI